MSNSPTWETLSLDQTLALRHAATRLAGEFDGIFGAETIERFLHSSYDQFAGRATVGKFLPLMAERFRDVIRPLRGLVLHGLVRLRPIGPPNLTARGRWVLNGPD